MINGLVQGLWQVYLDIFMVSEYLNYARYIWSASVHPSKHAISGHHRRFAGVPILTRFSLLTEIMLVWNMLNKLFKYGLLILKYKNRDFVITGTEIINIIVFTVSSPFSFFNIIGTGIKIRLKYTIKHVRAAKAQISLNKHAVSP